MAMVTLARMTVGSACLSCLEESRPHSGESICRRREPREPLRSPPLNRVSGDLEISARLTSALKMTALQILRAAWISLPREARSRTILVGWTSLPFVAGKPECRPLWVEGPAG
jgi:hypothetical protein